MITYKQHGGGDLNLALGAENNDEVGGGLLVGEPDLRVGLRLDVMDEYALLAEERTMVPTRHGHRLIYVVLILQSHVSIGYE